jgi:hypothetical protein
MQAAGSKLNHGEQHTGGNPTTQFGAHFTSSSVRADCEGKWRKENLKPDCTLLLGVKRGLGDLERESYYHLVYKMLAIDVAQDALGP